MWVGAIVAGLGLTLTAFGNATSSRAGQENFPPPPADRTLIYWQAGKDSGLSPLHLETATTNLRPEVAAGRDKSGRVELSGENAPTSIPQSEPHFFLFVPDSPGGHPPMLVRLMSKGGVRRVTAMTQRGQRGLAIVSEEIVKPHYRVLRRGGGTMYMEVWGRESLLPGEYAFIGPDLTRVATFRVTQASIN